MSGRERRTSPRKECVVPLRFRVVDERTQRPGGRDCSQLRNAGIQDVAANATMMEGEALNHIGARNLFHFTRSAARRRAAGNVLYASA